MKKRKILSWILSLALVFSMTSAFVVTASANEGDPADSGSTENLGIEKVLQLDGAYAPTKVDCVEVNGVELHDGQYIYYYKTYDDGPESDMRVDTPPAASGYAWYHDGRLELNSFKLEAVSEYAIYAESDDDSIPTLYIDIIGQNSISMDSSNGDDAIYADGAYLVFSKNEKDASLEIDCQENENDAIEAEYIKINSGKYIIKDANCGIYVHYDVLINDGSIQIEDSEYGLYSCERTIINGGKIDTKNCYYGIYSNSSVNIYDAEIDISGCTETGIYADNNIIIDGGNIVTSGGECGIHSDSSLDIYDSEITIKGILAKTDGFAYGIRAFDDVNIDGGKITIKDITAKSSAEYDEAFGIRAARSLNINGGEIIIKDIESDGNATGIFTKYWANIKGGKITISEIDSGYDAVGIELDLGSSRVEGTDNNYSYDNYDEDYFGIDISNSEITISDIKSDYIEGIETYYNTNINNSKITMSDFKYCTDLYAFRVVSDGDLNFNSSEITISEISAYSTEKSWCNLIYNQFDSIAIDGGKITISDIQIDSGECDVDFIYASDDVNIDGGEITISDIQVNSNDVSVDGISADFVKINNAAVDIVVNNYAIYANNPVEVNNSKITAQSETDEAGYYAIYPSVKLTGNPTIYAGSTPADKELITSKDSLGTYQYVEIINEQTVSSNFISSIISNITKLFTSTSKFNLGSMLSYLLIGKLLIKIIKIL